MGLFKKNVLIITIFLLHTYAINAKLTKSEERQAMLLKNHLRRLAFRSRYKPLPATAQTRVESIVKKLEDFDKKDPESHVAEQVQEFVKAIKYETPSVKEEKEVTEERKEKPAVKPPTQESAAAELLKKQDVALNEFIEHLLLLQNTQETWKENKPIDSWKEKALELLKKPELFDITLENNLNVPSALLDALINRYNYFILSASSQDKQEEVDALKVVKTEYINTMINSIFKVYVTQLYQQGAFWNAQTQTIDKVWQNEVLNFLCYALRIDFSDQRLKILQEAFNKVITEKYTKENVTATEQLEATKTEAANFLKKCQENLNKRNEALKEPLQQSASNFETLMNIIASARSATAQEKEQHEQQALVQAISWIKKVSSDDELNTVVSKIKKMYRDALHTQVKPWYAWAGMYTGNEETVRREQAFNTKLDTMIEKQLEKAPAKQPQQSSGVLPSAPREGEPVPPAPPASEQPQVPAPAQVPSEQIPGQQAPSVSPGVQPPATGAQEQAETEEEKQALLKQYINTLTTESIDKWKVEGVEGDEWDAVIKDEWLNGLLKVCKDNGIPINENIVTLLLEKMGKDNWIDVIRNTHIAQKSYEKLNKLEIEAEQKIAAATKSAQINKQLSDYIATLKNSNNWGFVEGKHQITNEWLAGLFNILKKNANIFSKEELEKLLRTAFAQLPVDIKVQNPDELIKKVVDNIEQNINAYKKVYLEELGSPSGLKYNYQGL